MVNEWIKAGFIILVLGSMFGLGFGTGLNHAWTENIHACVDYYDYLMNETCPAMRYKYNEETLDFNTNRTDR